MITAKIAPKYRATGNIAAVPGRQVASADQPIGETRIIVVDSPLVTGGDPNKPVLAVFAAGTQPGWKRAGLSIKVEDEWREIGGTAPSAIMGSTRNALAAHHAFLTDEASDIEIELLNRAMMLPLRNTSPLVRDAPIFWIGGEFVRVGCIAAQSGTRYRFSRLLRGCYTSSGKAPAHVAGTPFVLMDSGAALPVPEDYSGVGQTITLEAQGYGDNAPVISTTFVEGLALKPLAPVHGRAYQDPDGGFALEWKRRSRFDSGWVDNVDQVQVEDQEHYRVTLSANDLEWRAWEVGESMLRISAAEMTASGLPQDAAPLFTVRQVGRFAQSDPLSFAVR